VHGAAQPAERDPGGEPAAAADQPGTERGAGAHQPGAVAGPGAAGPAAGAGGTPPRPEGDVSPGSRLYWRASRHEWTGGDRCLGVSQFSSKGSFSMRFVCVYSI